MIYFAERGDRCIKIGYCGTTRAPNGGLTTPERDRDHARNCLKGSARGAGRLKLLAVMAGTFADEAALHRRFDDCRIEDDHEWFHSTKSLRAFIQDLDPVREPERGESCRQWLERVGTPEARHNIEEHRELQLTRKSADGWPLWQLCAGIKHGQWLPLQRIYVVHSTPWAGHPEAGRGKSFCFHVFIEACRREGLPKEQIPIGALKAGVLPRSHRGRWSEQEIQKRKLARLAAATEEELRPAHEESKPSPPMKNETQIDLFGAAE